MGIHNYDLRYQAAVENVKNADISQRNKNLILYFTNDRMIQGISKPRLMRFKNNESYFIIFFLDS